MTLAAETDKLANAKAQGQAQFDSIREMVEAIQLALADREEADESGGTDEAYNKAQSAVEDAERAIHDDALTVEVRGPWVPVDKYHPQSNDLDTPAEYRILLSTGGPAVQIVGELNEYGEPVTAVMQVQDWFTPWTDYVPRIDGKPDRDATQDIMLAYARCFYFGE
jgi:hypothetical protein